MDNEKDNPGYVTSPLCLAHRKHLETKIDNMEKGIKSTILIVGTVSGLILAVLQLAIHFIA